MTTAVDALVIIFEALAPAEQEDAFKRLADVRARHLAGEDSEMAGFLRSLRRVTEQLGHVPNGNEYKAASRELIAAGEDLETYARFYSRFGSWRRVEEALALSEVTTARGIEARFRARRKGKVWRYTEDTLRETLARCVEHYGRPPMVAEFEQWRERELELAVAQGNDALHLPSNTPYRRRWGTWEATLLHFGYTPDQVAERLEG